MGNFTFSRIRLEYKAITDFKQPYFLGSAIRGVLGRRLKKIVCIKINEECKNCEFNKTCPYTVVFETELYLNQPSKYVMIPEYEEKEVKKGNSIYVDITLLGNTLEYWQFIIEALRTTINLGKGRLIKHENNFYYHPFEEKYFPIKSFIPKFEAKDFFSLNIDNNHMILKLYPTSLRFKGKYVLAREFNKDFFVKALVSRISNVAKNYGNKNDKIFIDKTKFEIEKKEFKPFPMIRWSNRKKRKMKIPAFTGYLKLTGDLQEIYPYIKIAENINIGKATSLGLGRLKIVEME